VLNCNFKENTKRTTIMGFKNLINSKKIVALFAMFLLGGTQLMAQTTDAAATATATTEADTSAMWTGSGLLCAAVFTIWAPLWLLLAVY
jgi:hypothetical protein